VEQLAQVGAGLRFGGIGPQLVGEAVPPQPDARTHRQAGQQALQTRCREIGDRLPVEPDRGFAEETDHEARLDPTTRTRLLA